jgi:hypothetical protein
MSIVTKILTYNQIQDLWGAGYTIVRRNRDPFDVDPKLIPAGMAYQWNPILLDVGVKFNVDEAWKPVPFSRHEGVFGPWGMQGDIYRDGLMLFEKPKVDVDAGLQRSRAKAEQNVTDWVSKNAALGITGHVNVGSQTELGKLDTLKEIKVGDVAISDDGEMAQVGSTKTIETIVQIPRDMVPHMAAIFTERDRLEAEVVRKDRTLAPGPIADKFYAEIDANKAAPWWPTLRAILLPIAVDNVRANLKKDHTDE